MPGITIEFSVPEDPSRNVVTVTIKGPDQKQVVKTATQTIEHYTGVMSPVPNGATCTCGLVIPCSHREGVRP